MINGKAIYEAKGKAAEYSKYAVSFFCGCSNMCEYCYLRKGRFAKTLGGDTPTLKKCFKNEEHALKVFEKELKANLPELQKHGLFFSFTTDSMIDDVWQPTCIAINMCVNNKVNVKLLTKTVPDWLDDFLFGFRYSKISTWKTYVAFGFTLTGHDELEPNASTNAERIEAMKKLHNAGFKTWASIEPVIDFESSTDMIRQTLDFCDLYKIGLESGKIYSHSSIQEFLLNVSCFLKKNNKKVYFKDSLLQQAKVSREYLPANCVNSDYDLFNTKTEKK